MQKKVAHARRKLNFSEQSETACCFSNRNATDWTFEIVVLFAYRYANTAAPRTDYCYRVMRFRATSFIYFFFFVTGVIVGQTFERVNFSNETSLKNEKDGGKSVALLR